MAKKAYSVGSIAHMDASAARLAATEMLRLANCHAEKIERLREIIDGALAHSFGPYSDAELLRRVIMILRKATEAVKEK